VTRESPATQKCDPIQIFPDKPLDSQFALVPIGGKSIASISMWTLEEKARIHLAKICCEDFAAAQVYRVASLLLLPAGEGRLPLGQSA